MTLEKPNPVKPPLHEHHRYRKFREWVAAQHPSVGVVYKVLVAIVGFAIIIVGVILIPLPGPRWLIVFAGFAFLGLEFPFAHKVTSYVKTKFSQVWNWLKSLRKPKQKG